MCEGFGMQGSRFFLFLGLTFFYYDAHSAEIDWLAFGDIRGNIETCGCDPRTDLGGIARIASLLQKERAFYPRVHVFDLGNNLAVRAQEESNQLKNRYLTKGLELMAVDAVLVNRAEIKWEQENTKNRPFVLSNSGREFPKEKIHKTYIVSGKVIVFGYYWEDDMGHMLQKWGKKLRTSLEEISKKHPEKKSVLLFSGNDLDLEKIARSNIFDLIISSNIKADSEQVGFDEKEDENKLLRMHEPMFVRMVPFGGVGVLRGGALANKHTPSVEDLLEEKKEQTLGFPSLQNSAPILSTLQQPTISWLDLKYSSSTPIKDLLKEYQSDAKELFKIQAKKKLKDLETTPFVGANACKGCHFKEFDIWSRSQHAVAYKTLEKEGKHENMECVKCHVLGAKEKGGFVSVDKTPTFAGVQCENCHGARKDHIKDPTQAQSKVNAKEKCSSCHHTPHSSSFKYSRYWQKIQHGN